MTELIPSKPYADHAIEPARNGEGFNVYEWGLHPKGSVLEGQHSKKFVDFSADQYALKLKYPGAEVFEHIVPCTSQVNPQAPAGYYGGGGGFYDAGEYWGEDDY